MSRLQGELMISRNDLLPILQKISLFGAIPEAGLDTIINRAEHQVLEAGEILFREDEPSSAIYILLEGKVKIVNNYGTEPLEIIELSTGSSLGEASLLGIQPHSATALVTEKASIMVITRTLLNSLHKENLELFSLLILNMARELARRIKRYSKYIKELEAQC